MIPPRIFCRRLTRMPSAEPVKYDVICATKPFSAGRSKYLDPLHRRFIF